MKTSINVEMQQQKKSGHNARIGIGLESVSTKKNVLKISMMVKQYDES